MRMRGFLWIGMLAGLGACAPTVPDSGYRVDPGRGVGFDNSIEAQRRREAALASSEAVPVEPLVSETFLPPEGGPQASETPAIPTARAQAAAPSPVTAQPLTRTAQTQTTQSQSSQSAELAQIQQQADATAASANSGRAVVNASPSNAPPVLLNNPGISDEQDFDAVSSRQSIESDAARIAANREQYQVVAPTALPSRSGSGEPNIVAYALETRHAPGTRLYRRSVLSGQSRYQRACGEYASADQAQLAFLQRGGPDRDRLGVDPDGDGFACDWDPRPFRRASGG
ncbi:MAG: hypothetical protein AAFR68_12410 [Pseudomonadota bacterium]